MRTLPMDSHELSLKVFKGRSIYDPVALSEIFNLDELIYMIDNGNFTWSDKNWIWSAIDKLSK